MTFRVPVVMKKKLIIFCMKYDEAILSASSKVVTMTTLKYYIKEK